MPAQMTEIGDIPNPKRRRDVRKRRCLVAVASLLLLLFTLFIVGLILGLTVFKAKDPRTRLVSATVDGIAPRLSFPAVQIELNVTLELQILVDNPNRASFEHGPGKSLVLYMGKQVGEVDLSPGRIPARGSEMLRCRLTLEADKLASNMSRLISDVMAGEIEVETRTRIPGRATLLGFIRKHVVATSECQIAIGFPDLKVRRQVCKNKAKF